MRRSNKFFIFLPASLLLLVTLLMAWLLRSETGARFIWLQADAALEAAVQVQELQGSLAGGLELRGFSYRDPSVQVSTPDLRLRLDIDLFPPALHIARLEGSAMDVRLLQAGQDEPGSSLAATLESLALPFPVVFDAVSLGRLRIVDEHEAELFATENLVLEGEWRDAIDISRAALRAFDTDWQVVFHLQLEPPFATRGTVSAATVLPLNENSRLPLQLEADVEGDLDRLATRIRSLQPAIEIEGELRRLLTDPGWDLQVTSELLHWPPAQSLPAPGTPLLSLGDISLSTQGWVDGFDLQLAAELSGEQIPGGSVELQGKGNNDSLDIDHLRLDGDEVKLSAVGSLEWLQEFTLAANTRVEYLQPQRWLPDWPQAHPLSAELQLEVSENQLAFRDLKLAVEGVATTIQAEGSYSFGDAAMAAQLQWQSLAWPIGSDTPDWSSKSGQLKLQGGLEKWQANGDLQLLASGFPEGRLQLDANGNAEGVHLLIPEGKVSGGRIAGEVNYHWAEPSHWSAEITADRINTTPLLPDFPAVLSGTVLAQSAADSSRMQFELRKVKGRVRGLDFTAEGKLSLQGSLLEADGLRLRSQSASLDLDGGMGPGQVLKFAAEAADLAQVLPSGNGHSQASGQIKASGELSLDARSPRFQVKLDGQDLRFGENHIGSIRTVEQADGSTQISIGSATLGGRQLQDVKLTLDGSQQLQSAEFFAVVNGSAIEVGLQGQLQSSGGPQVTGWQGNINTLRLSRPELGSLQLESPAPLLLSSQEVQLGSTCLLGSKEGRICLQGGKTQQGEASLQTELQQVSLDLVRLFVEMDWTFTNHLDGRLDLHKSPGQPAVASASFRLSPGELLFAEESTNFSTGPGVFEFQVVDGNLHSGKLNIPIIDSGEINMDFALNRLQDGAAAELQAQLNIQLRDLTPLRLLPYVDEVRGELNADIRVAGSLQNPQFTGHATLVRGHIAERAAGLVLSEIQLAGAVYQDDHTELFGSFRAGEGRGNIKADLYFGDFLHPEFSLQLSGENLLLVDVPDLNLAADPDLDIRWASGALSLNGKVAVPKAQLSPRYLPATTASESPDLVIVSGQEETAVVSTADIGPLRITGQVGVELGPEVKLTLDKATARIHGKSTFTWNNSLVPIGNGAFVVSGEIYAYGQLLTISEGRVSFPNVLADNPHLNIKAEREIFGNTQIKHAGVWVNGTLKRPDIDPYTDPISNRERALALLLTGSDFDYEQGVGAVEVGMYIAPKLYISYGIGLFDDQNVISARYDLGRGFGVKATSGQRETGVDMSYTVDR